MSFISLFALSIILPLVVCVGRAKRVFTFSSGLFFFLIVSFICDGYNFWIDSKGGINQDGITIFFIIQTICVPLIFAQRTWRSNYFKAAISLVLGFSVLLAVMIFELYLRTNSYSTIGFSLSSILILLCCILYFYHQMRYEFDQKLWQSSFFYIAAGFYLYHSVVTIIYLTMLELPQDEVLILWPLKMAAYGIQNVFFTYGLLSLSPLK